MRRLLYLIGCVLIAGAAATVAYQINTGSGGSSAGTTQQGPSGDRYKDFKLK